MNNRKTGFTYVFFYILFLPDTYRIMTGLAAAWLLAPSIIASQPMTYAGKTMIWVMLICIGYAASGKIGDFISKRLQKLILRNGKR